MLTGKCCCGAVSVTIDAKPDYIHDCNCSICRKLGGAWGYFQTASVRCNGETKPFSRRDKEKPGASFHSCPHCATVTHWTLTDSARRDNPGADVAGVNMRIFDPHELKGVEVRYPDGVAWAGEGPFGYRRDALMISDETPW